LRPNVLCIDPLGDNDFGAEILWEDLPKIDRPMKSGRRYRVSLVRRAGIEDLDIMAAKIFRFILLAAERDSLPKPFTLYVDEADRFGNAYWNDRSLKYLANYGRHWDISFIVNARRYAAIPKDWTSQSDVIVMGPSVDIIADGRIVSGLIGRERMKQWESLERYQFIGKGLDGIGYIRYNGYDEDGGYIGYTRF